MRNSLLHYLGIIVAIIGFAILVGPYAGLNMIDVPSSNCNLTAGVIIIIIGVVLFFAIDE